MRSQPQQTIKLAIDCKTGELVPAESLLSLEEVEFSALRRDAMSARVERRRGGNTVRFQCAICRQPVFLSRYREGSTNRWFVHDGKSEHCPWHERNRLTPEQTKALIYRGQQEGERHREMKRFVAQWLAKDILASEISEEQTTFSEVVKGEWRRPDVKCKYQGKSLVFEIQLSYTFLSDVIARDEFYRREGIFIIWVFASFDRSRAAVTDEAFFNRRNLFVLDAEAMSQTMEREILTINGYRQVPRLVDGQICDVWTAELVDLKNVVFPSETMRPYFFDYDAARKTVETLRLDLWNKSQEEIWAKGVKEYLDIALRYYESDYAAEIKDDLLAKAGELSENSLWHRGFETLQIDYFYGHHAVLPALMSIKLNRPVGYKVKSVYQVIEAGLRTGHYNGGKHAFAILYLWAYKTYKPTVTEKNRQWLRDYASKVLQSVEGGESTYRRYVGHDEAIGLLFPELEEHLVTTFGT